MEASGPPGSGATSLELTVKPRQTKQSQADPERGWGGGGGRGPWGKGLAEPKALGFQR